MVILSSGLSPLREQQLSFRSPLLNKSNRNLIKSTVFLSAAWIQHSISFYLIFYLSCQMGCLLLSWQILKEYRWCFKVLASNTTNPCLLWRILPKYAMQKTGFFLAKTLPYQDLNKISILQPSFLKTFRKGLGTCIWSNHRTNYYTGKMQQFMDQASISSLFMTGSKQESNVWLEQKAISTERRRVCWWCDNLSVGCNIAIL